jgi:hypothetical protein
MFATLLFFQIILIYRPKIFLMPLQAAPLSQAITANTPKYNAFGPHLPPVRHHAGRFQDVKGLPFKINNRLAPAADAVVVRRKVGVKSGLVVKNIQPLDSFDGFQSFQSSVHRVQSYKRQMVLDGRINGLSRRMILPGRQFVIYFHTLVSQFQAGPLADILKSFLQVLCCID